MSRDPGLFLESHMSIQVYRLGKNSDSPPLTKALVVLVSASPLAGHLEQPLCLKELFGVSDVESETARSSDLFSKCIEPILSLQHQQDPERVTRTAVIFLPELVWNYTLISDFFGYLIYAYVCVCVVPSFYDQTLSNWEKYLKVLTRTNDMIVNISFDNICALGSGIWKFKWLLFRSIREHTSASVEPHSSISTQGIYSTQLTSARTLCRQHCG